MFLPHTIKINIIKKVVSTKRPFYTLYKIDNFLKNIYRFSGYIAALFLILVATFILIGIASRIFGFYIRGLAEYSGYCMAASSFFALAYTFVEGGHIRITLFL